jgi:hypothetical protein
MNIMTPILLSFQRLPEIAWIESQSISENLTQYGALAFIIFVLVGAYSQIGEE